MSSDYAILGVNPTATKEEIKKAYHKLALIYHPDKPTGDQAKFIEIKNAYDKLIVFEPQKTHNFYQAEKHLSYVVVFFHHYDKNLKGVYIDMSFSRDFTHFDTPNIDGCYHRFEVRGLNGGWVLINLEYLIKCNFKFELHCHTNYGKVFVKSFTYKDPRSWYTKFITKYLTLKRIIGYIVIYWILGLMFLFVKWILS